MKKDNRIQCYSLRKLREKHSKKVRIMNISNSSIFNQFKLYMKPNQYENKVYKEDTEDTFIHNHPLENKHKHLQKDSYESKIKNKSIDHKRHRTIDRMKSMPYHQIKQLVDRNRILSSNFFPGAGK